MPNTWVIAPYAAHPADRFDQIWAFDLARGYISVGWEPLGDISSLNYETLLRRTQRIYADRTPRIQRLFTNMLWSFYHEIVLGDTIFARRGVKTLMRIGDVTKTAFYAPKTNLNTSHENFLGISWRNTPLQTNFDEVIFPMQTLSRANEAMITRVISGL